MPSSTLSDKTIVITGASSGVGRAMAVELAAHGARVVLTARREEALREVAAECEAVGGTACVLPADVRFPDSLQEVARGAQRFGGSIDVWINNAGVLAATPFDRAPAELQDEVVKTNLLGYMHGAYAALPFFKQQGRGILINNISIGGWFPTPYAAAYTASKFGIRGFSEALKGELTDFPHIHVCDLYPAFLDTPGIQHAANYMGVALRPAPPVYDPRKVARAVAALIQDPRRTVTIGAAAHLLKWSYETLPGITRSVTAGVIRRYRRQADPMENTPGNVEQPVEFGRGIDGGWSTRYQSTAKKNVAVFLTAAFVGFLLLYRR